MDIENEIFKKCIILYDKLIPYGFIKNDDNYSISKNILDDTFKIEVTITNQGLVQGKIYDLSFNEEYINYRIENQNGEFVNRIREEFKDFLIDIKNNCTNENYFVLPQTNRLINLIIKKYGNHPEFPWEDSTKDAIFRNPNNGKWYGLIMTINKNKLDDEDREVEVLNVKLDEDEILELLNRQGFYKAYHMNKKKWITILLDDSISDEEIMKYIEESHRFTESSSEWLIPANPKYYDVINCFNNTDIINWKQSNNIKVGDIVYLYVASPIKAILYKCEVLQVNIPYEYKDKDISMKRIMQIKLLKRYPKEKYTFTKLQEYGIKSIRGPRSITKKLSNALNQK